MRRSKECTTFTRRRHALRSSVGAVARSYQTSHGGWAPERPGTNRTLPSHRRWNGQNSGQAREAHNQTPQCLGHSTSGNGLSHTRGNQTGTCGLGKVTPAETMDGPTREFFAIGILGSGVDRGLHSRCYECLVQHRKARASLSNLPRAKRAQDTPTGRRSKTRRRPLALVQDRPPGRENQMRLGLHAVAGRDHRNLSRPRTPSGTTFNKGDTPWRN